MLKLLSKLSVIPRLVCIVILFYTFIKLANYSQLFRGNFGLIISTLILGLLALIFFILIPNNSNEN
jgi:hypothetical protein